jgi:hypothetical protein
MIAVGTAEKPFSPPWVTWRKTHNSKNVEKLERARTNSKIESSNPYKHPSQRQNGCNSAYQDQAADEV